MLALKQPLDMLRPALAGLSIALRTWRFVAASAAATVVIAILIGIPTDVVPNPWYTRMTAIEPEQYVWWAAVSLTGGMLLGTYALTWGSRVGRRSGIGGGVLGYLAVGCPICNKLVIAALGTSGALTYFAPLQPALGTAAVLLALAGLIGRLRILAEGCQVGQPGASAP